LLDYEKSIYISSPLIAADHTATENIINCDVKKSLTNACVKLNCRKYLIYHGAFSSDADLGRSIAHRLP